MRRVATPKRLIADRAYDARKLRDWLTARGCDVVIPPNPTRKNPYPWDKTIYRARNVIERMFCRLKDFRRVATRYDKRADTYLSAVFLAATVTWWLNRVLTLEHGSGSRPAHPRTTVRSYRSPGSVMLPEHADYHRVVRGGRSQPLPRRA